MNKGQYLNKFNINMVFIFLIITLSSASFIQLSHTQNLSEHKKNFLLINDDQHLKYKLI